MTVDLVSILVGLLLAALAFYGLGALGVPRVIATLVAVLVLVICFFNGVDVRA